MDCKFEKDDFWFELLRLDELGLPASWNFVIPDKLMHFLTVFLIGWLLTRWLHRVWAALIPWLIMMILWEIIWDCCFRNGFSWQDAVANTLGALVLVWWKGNDKIGQAQ